MKRNTFIILSILIGVGLKSFGQKLEKSKTDDPAKRTSWETFYTTMSANAYFRISSVGDTETFDLKYQDGTVFSIMKDDEIIFKLDNGELIKLPNLENKI
ncbi:MAG: hypothetical protein JWP44_1888, partial [Mucilaginibacter sp.]|nr:hypothetical protein [Mucilaginibacter sp.]